MSLADKASLLLIPTGYKSQKVYSIFPTDGDGDFDFSRSSSATRIAKNGLITTVAANVPRLNYTLIDGVVNGCPSLLLEPQRTNYQPYSNDFSQSVWIKTSIDITSNNTISPDGALNGTKLNENTVSSTYFRLRGGSVATTGANTLSIFAKASERNWIKLRENAETGVYAYFDLQNGTVGQSNADDAIIEYYGNGWYKLSITDVLTSVAFDVRIAIADGVDAYNGVIGNGVYVWGAQLEQGSYATSYIPTQGSVVTRLADECNGAGNADTFNDSEGVLFADISAFVGAGGGTRRIEVSNAVAASQYVRLQIANGDGSLYGIVNNGTQQFLFNATSFNATLSNKISLKYKQNDFSLFLNGFEVGSSNVGNTFANGILTQANFSSTLSEFYGNTKELGYYDTALTDEELEYMTSYRSLNELVTELNLNEL